MTILGGSLLPHDVHWNLILESSAVSFIIKNHGSDSSMKFIIYFKRNQKVCLLWMFIQILVYTSIESQ